MLAHRLRRWPNIGQTSGRCVVFAGMCLTPVIRRTDGYMLTNSPGYKRTLAFDFRAFHQNKLLRGDNRYSVWVVNNSLSVVTLTAYDLFQEGMSWVDER